MRNETRVALHFIPNLQGFFSCPIIPVFCFFPLKTKSMFMQTLQSCAKSLLAHGMWLTRTIRGSMTITNYRIFCCGCSPQAFSSTFDFSRVVPVVDAPLSLESWHQPQRQGHTWGGGIPTFSVNWFLWLRCFVIIQCRACEIYLQYIADFFMSPPRHPGHTTGRFRFV